MLTTDSDTVAERVRLMSLHGLSKDAWNRYRTDGSWEYDVMAPGFKYNMGDIAAALGIAQLKKLNKMWRRRTAIAQRYNEAFATDPELEAPVSCDNVTHAWHLYMLRLNLDQLAITRDQFIEELRRRGISSSVHFIPLHLHSYYRGAYGYEPSDCPVAFAEYKREISLPIYSRMTDQDVSDVINAVREVSRLHQQTNLYAVTGH